MVFSTVIDRHGDVLSGPWRSPRQMLAVQEVNGHASIHDDATANALGFKGGTIEGPTHFSQFAPLAHAVWGNRWLAHGCLSAHYRAPVFEGEHVRAILRPDGLDSNSAEIWMERDDGTEILRGSASVGPEFPKSALEQRLASLPALETPVILADLELGARSKRSSVGMDFDQEMGALYPFTLRQKLAKITEPSPVYYGISEAYQRPILPLEMVSVLMQYTSPEDGQKSRGPAVGLFADQEIRLVDGPVYSGRKYEIEREIVFLSGSRRTESAWTRTTLYHFGTTDAVAHMLLNVASLKETYALYASDYQELYGAPTE